MGIQGLWKLLRQKGCLVPTEVSELRGSVAAVDISCWLCAVLGRRGSSVTTSTLNAEILDKINQLTRAGIQTVIVFDGERPPAKDATAALRFRQKKKLSRAVVSVPLLCKLFKTLNIPFIIAPFEADCQIVELERQGLVNLVVSLDSDFIVHGCKRILFRLKHTGMGMLYEQVALTTRVLGAPFELNRLRWCCILVGSDYWPGGVKGVGRVAAMRIYARTRHITDLEHFLEYVEAEELALEDSFRQKFMVAERTFLHQIVFDVKEKVLKHLSPAPPSLVMPYVGSLNVEPGECFIEPDKLSGMDLPAVAQGHYKCPICVGVRFDSGDEKRAHWIEIHRRETRPFKCGTCPATFTNLYAYRRHLRSHAGLKPIKCPVCGVGFRDLPRVKVHMARYKMGERTFPCTQCDKVFLYRSSLFTHLQAHEDLRKFKCSLCDCSFAFLSHLQKHQAVHTKEQKYSCPHCPAKFTQVGSRNTHVKRQHTNPEERWQCDKCDKDYASNKGLLRHQRQSHKED